MKKKLLCGALAVASLFTLASCGGDEDKGYQEIGVSDGGKVLNIRAWNDEFQSRFRAYYPEYDRTDD